MTDEHKQFKGKLAKKRKFGSDMKYGQLTENDSKYIEKTFGEDQTFRHQLARFMCESEMLGRNGRRKQDLAMLPNLFKHFDIAPSDPDRYLILSLELARIAVPGFQYEAAPRGRRTVWDVKTHIQLLIDIENVLHKHPGWSLNRVCEHLIETDKYSGMSSKSLYNRYLKAKNENKGFPCSK